MAKPALQKAAANKLDPKRQDILDIVSGLVGMFEKNEEEPVDLPEEEARLKDEYPKQKKIKPLSGKKVLVEDRFRTGVVIPEEEEADFKARERILGSFEDYSKNVEGLQNIVDLLTIGGGLAGKSTRTKMDAKKALASKKTALDISDPNNLNKIKTYESPIFAKLEEKLNLGRNRQIKDKIEGIFDAVVKKSKEQESDSKKPGYIDDLYETGKTIKLYDILSLVYDLEQPMKKDIRDIVDYFNESPSFKAGVSDILKKINTGRKDPVSPIDLFADIPIILESQAGSMKKGGSFIPSENVITLSNVTQNNERGLNVLVHELAHALNRIKYLRPTVEPDSILPIEVFEDFDPLIGTLPFFQKQNLITPQGNKVQSFAEQETYFLAPLNKFSYLKTGRRLNNINDVVEFGKELERDRDLQKELFKVFTTETNIHRHENMPFDEYIEKNTENFLNKVMKVIIEKLKTDETFQLRVIQEAKEEERKKKKLKKQSA